MSTYYYFHAIGTNEYFELTSGGWYTYLEDLRDILCYCIKNKKSYKVFIDKIKKDKVFQGFYDDYDGSVSAENEKYFLQPLYNWAFEHSVNSSYYEPIRLIADDELYELAIQLFCAEKGIKYEPPKMFHYTETIEKALEKYDKTHRKNYWDKEQNKWVENTLDEEETLIDHYLKCVGKLDYDNKIMCEIGVSFEHALAELKAGARIHRKSEPYIEWWLENGEICWNGEACATDDGTEKELTFYSEEVLADDWEYEYQERSKENV